MEQGAITQAADIVRAQAGLREMTEDEMISMMERLAVKFQQMSGQAVSEASGPDQDEEKEQEPAVDPKKSIKPHAIFCIECGQRFRILSKKHLATHGLTPAEYKEKWGLKKKQSLVCKDLAKMRKDKMESMELWKQRKQRKPAQASA